MLKLTSISKRFGGLSVLQDVNIEVPQGTIFGLIGPNGAGKTTVFNLITGLLAPTGGSRSMARTWSARSRTRSRRWASHARFRTSVSSRR